MDLALLLQLRAHDNPLAYGCSATEEVAKELQGQDPKQFHGLKKSVRDHVF